MTAFATTNHENLRYWTISAGIVVLMHAAIAAAVLSWRNATAPAERPGPVVIELAPMPAAPPAEQAILPPAAAPVPSLAAPSQPLPAMLRAARQETRSACSRRIFRVSRAARR